MVRKLVCLYLLAACAAPPQVLTGVRLIDGTGGAPAENAVIILADGRISAINPKRLALAGAVENLSGKTVIPGLINAHGHLGVVVGTKTDPGNFNAEVVTEQLNQYARYGVTSVLALGLSRDLIYNLREDQKTLHALPNGATIFTAGRGIGVPGGAPPMNVGADQVYRPSTSEEARAAVREMAAHRPDIIKIWVDDIGGSMPKMKPEIYRAVIDEAHKNNLRVAAHVYYLADAKSLVDAGVNVLAHSIRDAPVDSALIDAMKSHHVSYIPTLELDESFFLYADRPALIQDPFVAAALSPEVRGMISKPEWREKVEHDPKTAKDRRAFANALRNLKAMEDAGITIAMGTDSGATPLRIQGFAEHLELALMVEAGLTPMQALVAATKGSAAVAGASNLGTLQPGNAADFIVLDANPLDDIRNTRKISAVWHNGKQLDLSLPR